MILFIISSGFREVCSACGLHDAALSPASEDAAREPRVSAFFPARIENCSSTDRNWAVDCKSGLERGVLRAPFRRLSRGVGVLSLRVFIFHSQKKKERERGCFARTAIRSLQLLIAPANWPNSRYVPRLLYNLFRVGVGNLIVLSEAIFRARSRDGEIPLPLKIWLKNTNVDIESFLYSATFSLSFSLLYICI